MCNDVKELSRKEYKTAVFLLTLYSLLPGIYKIIDNQLFMLLCIPIITYLLYKHWRKNIFYRFDGLFLFFLSYIFFLSFLQLFSSNTNKLGLFMGVFLDIIPMSGFLFAKLIRMEDFIKILVPIGIIHLLLGILLYPMFGLVELIGEVGMILTEGVAIGRMASVSGSLGFASLMFMTSIGALYYKRKYFFILLFGVICAAQRSGWLACLTGILLFCYINILKGNYKYTKYLLIGIISFVILLSYIISITDFDISFFVNRFEDIGNAASERDGQWIAGVKNFLDMPIGTGCGQVGQVAARYEEGFYRSVPDGDYFRIISEYGIMGAIFYLIIIFLSFVMLLNTRKCISVQRSCCLSVFIGLCIQMIGSNITEFYFTNFLYWTFIGYLFVEYNNTFVSKGKII